MMPLFFHLESHLWIAYLFFVNGFVVSYFLGNFSEPYRALTNSMEARILAAFFISISINGLLLLGLDLAGLNFSLMKILLPALSAVLVCAFAINFHKFRRSLSDLVGEVDAWRLLLYSAVFVVLFYNGGLIEQTSDAWWHMSLANKIGINSTFTLEQGHLNGLSNRYYPPLWHGNLALANLISNQSLPVLWDSFTAWGSVLKVMSFFLMALSLGNNKAIASLSALLFVLLPGLGNSYLRVSAWPSHISYMAWFCLFYVNFSILDSIKPQVNGFVEAGKALFDRVSLLACFVALSLIITFSHQLELLLFLLGLLAYFFGLSIYRVLTNESTDQLESAQWIVNMVGTLMLVGAVAISSWFAYQQVSQIAVVSDISIAYFIPLIFLLVIAYIQLKSSSVSNVFNSPLAIGLLVLIAFIMIISIDLRHLLSLFDPELAYPKAKFHELPLLSSGWLGGELNVPGWHLQLRAGLLYSGVIAVPLSVYLAFSGPSRITVFLASNCLLAFLFLISPYLFHWFGEILAYHSPWRIAILIFHPIVFAVAIHALWQKLANGGEQ